jgi:hypothetical protein
MAKGHSVTHPLFIYFEELEQEMRQVKKKNNKIGNRTGGS